MKSSPTEIRKSLKLPKIFHHGAEALLDLLFPKLCHGCGQEGTYLCLPCQAKVTCPPARCFVCRKPSLLGRTHADCQTHQIVLDALLVAADYENEAVKNLIWNLKYNYIAEIASVLAVLQADYFLASDLLAYFQEHLVIPVPLHKNRKRARGFNQSELLAQNLAGRLGLPYWTALLRHKNSKRQVDLEKAQRFENVKDSVTADPAQGLKGKKIILIDDVATTGATLNECARALKAAGAAEVWGLVVARN